MIELLMVQQAEEGSFGRWARKQLAPWVECGSIRFVGHLPFANYARLLKSSHVHCYLTRPFVASWSLLDAMASGCCIVASDLEAVREIADPRATAWVDHRQHGQLVDVLEYALKLDPMNVTFAAVSKGIGFRSPGTENCHCSDGGVCWRSDT